MFAPQMIGLVLLMLVVSLGKVEGLASLGAGGALRFVGLETSHRQAVRTRVYPADTFVNGFSVLMWYKPSLPLTQYAYSYDVYGSAGAYWSMFEVNEVERKEIPMIQATDYNVGNIFFRLEGQDFAGFSQGPNNIFRALPPDNSLHVWQHFSFSFDPLKGEFLMANNAGDGDNEVVLNSTTTPAMSPTHRAAIENFNMNRTTMLLIGSAMSNDYDLTGNVDDFCVVKRTLTIEEMANIRKYGCLQGLGNSIDVVTAYSFDHANDPMYDESLGRTSGTMSGTVLDSNGDLIDYPYSSGKGKGPFHVSSSAPIFGNQIRVLRSGSSDAVVNITLQCEPTCDSFKITSLPNSGNLLINGGSVTLNQVIPTSDDNATMVALEFQPTNSSSAFGSVDTFQAEANQGGSAEVLEIHIITNTPPTVHNHSITMQEGDQRLLFIPNHPINFEDPDGDTDFLKVVITEFVGEGVDLYDCDNCDQMFIPDYYSYAYDDYSELQTLWTNPIVTLPHQIINPARRVVIKHDQSSGLNGEKMFAIKFKMFDGIDFSNEGTVWINVPPQNMPPEAQNHQVTMMEDSAPILIDFAPLIHDRENDTYVVEIEKYPDHGILYQEFDSNSIVNGDSGSQVLAQWVIESPLNDASSCWDQNYCVNASAGPPDVYPLVGDFAPTWQPETSGFQTVTFTYETPVYAKEVTIYEVWSPGSITKIEVENHESPGSWVSAYEGPSTLDNFCPDKPKAAQCAGVTTYKLARKPFQTRRIRLTSEVYDAAYWPAIDAVLLSGVSKMKSDAILYNPNSHLATKLYYKPDPDFTGQDSFGFAVADDAFYKLFANLRGPDTRRGVVTVNVDPVADLPRLQQVPQVARWFPSNGTANMDIQLIHMDGISMEKNNNIKVISISSFENGRLMINEDILVDRVPFQVPLNSFVTSNTSETSRAILFTLNNAICQQASMELFTFTIQFEDDLGETETKDFNFEIQCHVLPSKYQRVGVSNAFSIVALCLFALGFVLVVICASWIVIRRTTQVVKLMSGVSNLTTISGALLVYMAMLFFPKDGGSYADCENIDALAHSKNLTFDGTNLEYSFRYCDEAIYGHCIPKLWLFSLGFTMAFSLLLTKAERCNMIFNNKKLRKVKFSSRKLISIVLAYCMFTIITLVVFQAAWPMRLEGRLQEGKFNVEAQSKVVLVYDSCVSDQDTGLTLVLVLFFGGMIARGAYLAYQTRNVDIPSMNDSKQIGLSIYNILVLGSMAFAISYLIDDPNTLFIATSIPIWLCTTIMLSILYIPHVIQHRFTGPMSSGSKTGKTMVSSNSATVLPTTSSGLSGDIHFRDEIEAEIERLQEKLNTMK